MHTIQLCKTLRTIGDPGSGLLMYLAMPTDNGAIALSNCGAHITVASETPDFLLE